MNIKLSKFVLFIRTTHTHIYAALIVLVGFSQEEEDDEN